MKLKEPVKIRCPNQNCQYLWDYRGRFSYYATCPSCRRNVKILDNKIVTLKPSMFGAGEATVDWSSPKGADGLGR